MNEPKKALYVPPGKPIEITTPGMAALGPGGPNPDGDVTYNSA